MNTTAPVIDAKPSLLVRELKEANLPTVAGVHMAAFSGSALTRLGIEAVRRYYEWQLLGPHDVYPIGAFKDGEMLGFCFGGVFRGAMSGFLNKNRGYLAMSVATHPWLMSNPIFREHLVTGVRSLLPKRGGAHTPQSGQPAEPKPFGILSIAVHPKAQGLGVGKLLMNDSEAAARRQGFKAMRLTVATDNEQAIGFYERLGWVKILTVPQWTGRMQKNLTNDE